MRLTLGLLVLLLAGCAEDTASKTDVISPRPRMNTPTEAGGGATAEKPLPPGAEFNE